MVKKDYLTNENVTCSFEGTFAATKVLVPSFLDSIESTSNPSLNLQLVVKVLSLSLLSLFGQRETRWTCCMIEKPFVKYLYKS